MPVSFINAEGDNRWIQEKRSLPKWWTLSPHTNSENASIDTKVISFSCWDQYLCMAFAQLTYRESLRDIQACLRASQSRLYHLGIRGKVSRNTLAHANQNRDWRIYDDFAKVIIAKARKLYASDSITIDLCLALFPRAEFRKRKGAVKLHTLLDLHGNISSVVIITTGKVHDVNILDQFSIETGGHLYYGSRLSRFRKTLTR